MPRFYGEPKCPTDVAYKAADGKAIALTCGSWNCRYCAQTLAVEWSRIARHGVENMGHEAYFQTFTLPGSVITRRKAFEILPRLWDNLRKSFQRHNLAWLYIAFVEGQPHREFMPHFHVLSSAKAHKRIKDLAVEVGFGYQAKEKRVSDQGAADYVSKYASKQGWDAPKGFRRVRASRKWPRPPDPPLEAYLVKAGTETLFAFLSRVSVATGRDVGDLYEEYRILMGEAIDEDEWLTYNKMVK